MLPSFFTDSVTVMRAPIATSSMRSERDWTSAATHEVTRCCVQNAGSSANMSDPARPARIDYVLLAPVDADVTEGDRIIWGGRTFVIDGAPTKSTPLASLAHVRANLVAWEG